MKLIDYGDCPSCGNIGQLLDVGIGIEFCEECVKDALENYKYPGHGSFPNKHKKEEIAKGNTWSKE